MKVLLQNAGRCVSRSVVEVPVPLYLPLSAMLAGCPAGIYHPSSPEAQEDERARTFQVGRQGRVFGNYTLHQRKTSSLSARMADAVNTCGVWRCRKTAGVVIVAWVFLIMG